MDTCKPQHMASRLVFKVETGASDALGHILLAHGAGTGVTSPFFDSIMALLAERDIAATGFEFTYMASRRTGGPKRPPPKIDALTSEYRDVLRTLRKQHQKNTRWVIGGKSLGGRVASLIADELYAAGEIAGLVCLGYPFHPTHTPESLRTAHLETLKCPTLIIQGDRDPFGNRTEVERLPLSKAIELVWMDDGDHDFGPRGRSGFTRKGNLTAATDAIAAFVARLSQPR